MAGLLTTPTPPAGPPAPLPAALRRAAAREAAGQILALLMCFAAAGGLAPIGDIMAGSVAAVAVLAVVHGILWRYLADNRRRGVSGIAPDLGAANRLTLLRGALIALTAGFAFTGPPYGHPATLAAWLPGSCYLAAAALDGMDGLYARRTGTETPLGRLLDLNVDALGVLVASGAAVAAGRLPAYYLSAGLAYYGYRAGVAWRRRRGLPVHPPPPRQFARRVAGFQMGFLGVALLPVFAPRVLAIAAPVLILPLLAGFWWDWRTVCGHGGDGLRSGPVRAVALLAHGPMLLRTALLATVGGMLPVMPPAFFPGGPPLLLTLAGMTAVGFLGRTAALVLSLLLAHAASAGLSPPAVAAALVVSLSLVLTGTGGCSLWRPEDAWLQTASGTDRSLVSAPALRRALVLAAGAGLFWWAWRDVDLRAVAAALRWWDGPRWLAFAVVNLAVLGAMCWRWRLILRHVGHPVGFADLVRYRMAANTLSFITPGPQFGGEPLQVRGLTCNHRLPRETAAASVAVDRLAELTGNLVFLSLAGLVVLPGLLDGAAALALATVLTAGAALAAGGLLFSVARGRSPFGRMSGWVTWACGGKDRPSGWPAFLRESERRAAPLLTGGLVWRYAGIGAAQWMAFLAELWLIYAFLGFAMGPYALMTTAVAMRLAFLLPLPGGLGALEAGQVLAVTSLGGDPVLAAAACGLMRFRDLVTISTGGLFAVRLLRSPLRRPPLRADAA